LTADDEQPAAGAAPLAAGRWERVGAAVVWLTIAALTVELLALLARIAIDLPRFGDVGYPDSALVIRLADFVRHGQLFPPLDRPPYLVTVYGPLTYLLLAVPYAAAELLGWNAVLALRIVEAGLLAACLVMLAVLARRFDRSAVIILLAVLFAASGAPLRTWALQLRGDFLGLLLSLSCVGLWVNGSTTRRFGGSAVLAALAILAKQTFVAAPVAVVVWLVWQRQLRRAAVWAGIVIGAVAAGYGVMLLREPAVIAHVAALDEPVFEYRGAAHLLFAAATHVKVLYGAAGALLLFMSGDRAARLVVLYWAISWLVAAATIPQIGGNVNYFWEPWFLSSLLGALGIGAALRHAARIPLVVAAMLVLLHFNAIGSGLLLVQREIRGFATERSRVARHDRMTQDLALAVQGHTVLSSKPTYARQSRVPVVPDPYLTSVLVRTGSWDPAPLLAAVQNGEFDIVIGYELDDTTSYRGLPLWNPLRHEAGRHPYVLTCRVLGDPVWFTAASPAALRQRVAAAGCS
jgi:hypothetical protein